MNAAVRLYEPQDRDAVRRIFLDTAVAGAPLGARFPDPDLLADLWTRYYTDDEPESLFVAESDRRVVGYLTGCRDDRRFARGMRRRWPAFLWAALRRGTLSRASLWNLLWHNRALAALAFQPARDLPQGSGHFHFNIVEGFRRQGWGRALVSAFIEAARAARCPALTATVREDNAPVQTLLERLNFHRLRRQRTFRWREESSAIWSVTYAREL